MSSGLYGSDEIRTLVEGESVLDGAFECLRRIWDQPYAISDRQLGGSEYQTRLLEQQLAALAPELYSELEQQTGEHPLPAIEHGCGIVMDALSVREGFRLARDLPETHDWTVEFDWAAVERLPTKTRFICESWFDSHAPSAVDKADFRYVGDMSVPPLPNTDPEFVWTRVPDKRLEDAMQGNYSIESVTEIYEDIRDLLVGIIEESVHDEFLVTSDHGYVNYLGNNPYALNDDLADTLASEFDGRHREVTNSYACQQLEEAGVIGRADGHYVVKGHYSWTKRGASSRVAHGGLSLPECMTPVLRINTGD